MIGNVRLLTMSAGTVACALGIGFVVQQGEGNAPVAVETVVDATISGSDLLIIEPMEPHDEIAEINLQQITLTSAQAETASDNADVAPLELVLAGLEAGILPALPADPVTPNLACDVTADATTAPGALVELTLNAPCYGNTYVTVHHNGLMFTETTDDAGRIKVTVPALAEHAVFVLSFENGKGAVAQIDVPTLGLYDRVALQWQGMSGLQIHAREFGAEYGGTGHVWSGSTSSGEVTTAGFVVQLGDPNAVHPNLAEVYTFPTGIATEAGIVALSVETEVTEATCDREIEAQTLEMRKSGSLRTRDLVLSMPDCTTTGDFLVLNNLLDDLKIAAN